MVLINPPPIPSLWLGLCVFYITATNFLKQLFFQLQIDRDLNKEILRI